MDSLTVLAIAVVALAAAFVLFVLVPRAVLAGFRESLEARIKHRYPNDPPAYAEYAANSFGVESRGVLQWRGNGALVLTDAELCFFQILVDGALVIPLERISALHLVHKHLGKETPSRFLRVEFRGESGPAAVAFWVPGPEQLKSSIEARLPRAEPTQGAS